MPIYEYQCKSCGLRDEKLWSRISVAQPTIPCTECGADMSRLVSAASFKFSHPPSQLRGMAPPNTGTSDDWKFDKIIGRDAEKKWGKIEKRNGVKDDTIRQERKAGRLVKREHLVPKMDGTGEYRVISNPERVKANTHRETAFKIAQAAKKAKAKGE
jgi:putative FmdB family regulatory protein